jgi:hypothetical protein
LNTGMDIISNPLIPPPQVLLIGSFGVVIGHQGHRLVVTRPCTILSGSKKDRCELFSLPDKIP